MRPAARIVGGGVRWALKLVIKILARDRRGGVLAHRKPYLGAVPSIQIVGRLGAPHLGPYPTGFKRVGENTRPAACDSESQQYIMQFRIGVSLLPSPGAVFPDQILQACITALVES